MAFDGMDTRTRHAPVCAHMKGALLLQHRRPARCLCCVCSQPHTCSPPAEHGVCWSCVDLLEGPHSELPTALALRQKRRLLAPGSRARGAALAVSVFLGYPSAAPAACQA
jgi:hypothetical protein